MTASMNWYRMFDKIQSVRVMGVVESFRMTPFCRSSAFMFTAPDRLDVITHIAMMPGTKKSMNRYLLVSRDVSAILMKGGCPDIPWFTAAKPARRIWILVDVEVALGLKMYVSVTDAFG